MKRLMKKKWLEIWSEICFLMCFPYYIESFSSIAKKTVLCQVVPTNIHQINFKQMKSNSKVSLPIMVFFLSVMPKFYFFQSLPLWLCDFSVCVCFTTTDTQYSFSILNFHRILLYDLLWSTTYSRSVSVSVLNADLKEP